MKMDAADFFSGFELTSVALPQGRVRLRVGGAGPALLLLHGDPQTHAMWHAIAPRLARHFTIVCPDLRGHGGSFKPAPTADHAAHGARAMADDMLALMDELGHARFAIAGHDRGAQVAHRMALDNPARVSRLAALDSVPYVGRPEADDMASALAVYPGIWIFEPRPLAEQVINLAPEVWFNGHAEGRPQAAPYFHPAALEDYMIAARDPGALLGIQESYRAAASIDRLEARISRAEGRMLACPVLALWGTEGQLGGWYDPRLAWGAATTGAVLGGPIRAGHYLAEEAPDTVGDQMEEFFVSESEVALA